MKLYVVGHPVAHSKSPAMHVAAYRALGLPWTYELMDCETNCEAERFFDARTWLAVNVTMPYKRLAFDFSDSRSRSALMAQGANVLVNRDGRCFADNTDGKGCVSYLQREGVRFDGAGVAVCGTGPTSLAIFHACAEAGAARVALLGRNGDRCAAALDEYQTRASDLGLELPDVEFFASSYECGAEYIASADIIADATPLGMQAGDPAPFNTGLLASNQTVFDVVYGHGVTTLVEEASKKGCRVFNGEGMLVGQALETVADIARVTGLFQMPSDIDLFAVMAEAAGFSSLRGL